MWVLSLAAQDAALRLIVPADGGTVKGTVLISVAPSQPNGVDNVEYWVNDQPISGPVVTPPFSFLWNTAWLWDGHAAIHALGRSTSGAVIASSLPMSVRIANGEGRISLEAPAAGRTLSGLVPWKVLATHSTGIEAISHVVDGDFQVYFQNTIPFDTRALRNGPHQVFNAVYAKGPPILPVAQMRTRVMVDNGHTSMGILPNWRTVFLRPSESVTLAARELYTDGLDGALKEGLTFSSSDDSVATVDEHGAVLGVATGVAFIRIAANGKKVQTRVEVSAEQVYPHFSRNGDFLTVYDPDRSLFVRTVFGLNADEIQATPGLGEQAQRAGINVLTEGLYANPGDSHVATLEAWRQDWDETWQAKLRTAARYGFSLYLTGDDIARTPNELNNSIANPWSAEAIRHAISSASDSGRVVAIDMIDEVNFLWGDDPTPQDGRWTKHSPQIPDDAFEKLMAIVNALPIRPAISWPVAGIASLDSVRNWQGDPLFSDFASHFWTFVDWRPAYPHGPSLNQYKRNMDLVALDRRASVRLSRPQLLQNSMTGPFYTKRSSGSEFNPAQDFLQNPGIPPVNVAAQVMYAAAMGQAGIRMYHYDTRSWKTDRRKASTGLGDLQTGAEPFTIGADRWDAMAAAFRLVERLEPYLLQPPLHSPELGASFVASVRQGPSSRLLLMINLSEADQTAQLDPTPYRYAEAKSATVFRLLGSSLTTETIDSAADRPVSFRPGETVVVLFTAQDPEAGQEIIRKRR